MEKRTLGRTGIRISPLGAGGWAMGGPFFFEGKPDGWGEVDDAESMRSIRRAIELDVNFFDTADVYGTGRSEIVLGRAVEGRRKDVVIATKFGFLYDEAHHLVDGTNVTPEYARQACERSLRRLNTDYIDLYQLHCGASPQEAEMLFDALDDLVVEGKIRSYGWSTNDPGNVALLAKRSNAAAVQFGMNALGPLSELVELSQRNNLTAIVNSPLASGLLSGKYDDSKQLPSDDFRAAGHAWATHFIEGRPNPRDLEMVNRIRDVLTSDGRNLVQGALAWVWATGEHTLPIPGFKTVQHVDENCTAMRFGPLTTDQMDEIAKTLLRNF